MRIRRRADSHEIARGLRLSGIGATSRTAALSLTMKYCYKVRLSHLTSTRAAALPLPALPYLSAATSPNCEQERLVRLYAGAQRVAVPLLSVIFVQMSNNIVAVMCGYARTFYVRVSYSPVAPMWWRQHAIYDSLFLSFCVGEMRWTSREGGEKDEIKFRITL